MGTSHSARLKQHSSHHDSDATITVLEPRCPPLPRFPLHLASQSLEAHSLLSPMPHAPCFTGWISTQTNHSCSFTAHSQPSNMLHGGGIYVVRAKSPFYVVAVTMPPSPYLPPRARRLPYISAWATPKRPRPTLQATRLPPQSHTDTRPAPCPPPVPARAAHSLVCLHWRPQHERFP
jgi:hypothetical protein